MRGCGQRYRADPCVRSGSDRGVSDRSEPLQDASDPGRSYSAVRGRNAFVWARYRSAVSSGSLIRALVAEDQPFLWTALYHAIYVPPGEPPLPVDIVQRPELARYVTGWMSRTGDQGLVAEARGEPVGAVWLRRWTPDDRGYGYIDPATPELSMAVLPEHRGRGIGTELLREALHNAA